MRLHFGGLVLQYSVILVLQVECMYTCTAPLSQIINR
uniref:Uncharacterized protein n=1 Tax=Anguilla anguilla TaxID=7936 RepID=A0A0E9UGW8_ANGAN